MPSTEPATQEGRAGMKEVPTPYEESWQQIPFESYEGITQMQYQEAYAPYQSHGKLIPVMVPAGWRRVEAQKPGKNFYIHMETGTICRYPREIYDTKKGCFLSKDSKPISEEAEKQDPLRRAVQNALAEKKNVMDKYIPDDNLKREYDALAKMGQPQPSLAVEQAEKPAKTSVPKKEAAPKAKPAPAPAPAADKLPVALLFPGQGSQYVKMLSGVKDIPAVAQMLDTAKGILGFDLLELCLEGPESRLEQTKFCQPAMYIGGLAAIEKLRADKPERVERCKAVAGLSLGEYTALTVAGVFNVETGLRIVKLRGEAMQEAAEQSKQSMLSVAGLDQATLDKCCVDVRSGGDVCQIANFLFPNGFSCAGSTEAIEKLQKTVLETPGCLQAKLLKTSGGFHTSLMAPAREKLLVALREAEGEMQPPRCDVYANLTGRKIPAGTPPSEIIPMLADQLTSCVLWEPSVRAMIGDGLTEFYECGPMKQLKAMMKRIDAEAFKNTNSIDV